MREPQPAEAELAWVRADLAALWRTLPWSVDPSPGRTDDIGWLRIELVASPAWTPEQQAEMERLRARERELVLWLGTAA
ncbi:hypothetical protein SRB5_39560 [Streptomyces sp. RB5]|uniref:Uncharacterized protein n=2 Tax=Streptomyces smaragdinus TaxID=2585196 RepID=A0A7K0CK71_9ACTN|nr:hypothetical protein [Streptomyces smaragdinus]